MGQALYHDGSCTCATLANLTQKVGLPGRGRVGQGKGFCPLNMSQMELKGGANFVSKFVSNAVIVAVIVIFAVIERQTLSVFIQYL